MQITIQGTHTRIIEKISPLTNELSGKVYLLNLWTQSLTGTHAHTTDACPQVHGLYVSRFHST